MDHQVERLPSRSGTAAKWQTAPLIGTARLDIGVDERLYLSL
jgi:hypothetical protein